MVGTGKSAGDRHDRIWLFTDRRCSQDFWCRQTKNKYIGRILKPVHMLGRIRSTKVSLEVACNMELFLLSSSHESPSFWIRLPARAIQNRPRSSYFPEHKTIRLAILSYGTTCLQIYITTPEVLYRPFSHSYSFLTLFTATSRELISFRNKRAVVVFSYFTFPPIVRQILHKCSVFFC